MNVLMASMASSLAIALVLTPFDMVAFKLMAGTSNVKGPTFAKVAKDVYRTRAGGANALSFAMFSTFVRYVFFTGSLHSYLNYSRIL
jgi:hypothetical protein